MHLSHVVDSVRASDPVLLTHCRGQQAGPIPLRSRCHQPGTIGHHQYLAGSGQALNDVLHLVRRPAAGVGSCSAEPGPSTQWLCSTAATRNGKSNTTYSTKQNDKYWKPNKNWISKVQILMKCEVPAYRAFGSRSLCQHGYCTAAVVQWLLCSCYCIVSFVEWLLCSAWRVVVILSELTSTPQVRICSVATTSPRQHGFTASGPGEPGPPDWE